MKCTNRCDNIIISNRNSTAYVVIKSKLNIHAYIILTHTHTHTRTHARTHAHTHTHVEHGSSAVEFRTRNKKSATVSKFGHFRSLHDAQLLVVELSVNSFHA